MVARLVALRSWSDRIDADHPRVERAATAAMDFVLRRQRSDGQLDLEGCYSPNEAGFPSAGLAAAYTELQRLDGDWSAELAEKIRRFLQRTGEALLAGQAYTANHRWAACAGPLAALHAVLPDPRYVEKIEHYLADGIDCDADGCWYEERSVHYHDVSNHGMLLLADYFGRTDLLDHVIRNLRFLLYHAQPNGEADTSYSFRQDRGRPGEPLCSFRIARRAAIHCGDGRLLSLAMPLNEAQLLGDNLMPLLFDLDRVPDPAPLPLPLPDRYERQFEQIQVVRRRRGPTALTLAADRGGHFYDTVRDQWGGVRRSEDWLCLHHGQIVIQSLQLTLPKMGAVQPQTLLADGPDRYLLAGREAGWDHCLHFRPGSPTVRMPWDLDHEIRLHWNADQLHVHLRCDTPKAVAATLIFWVRATAAVTQEDGKPETIDAGQRVPLRGGSKVALSAGTNRIELHGLPASEHHTEFLRPATIPTATPEHCGRLTLGLRLPIDLKFSVRFA